jgi:hypothetical protein
MPTEAVGPISNLVSERLAHRRYDAIFSSWQKLLTRLDTDRDGAITAARTLLETTCKMILDDFDKTVDGAIDLPKLYHTAATELGIAPNQHTEELFRALFGSSQTIVNRIGELRNKLGDAHARGNMDLTVPRHYAELVINLAGSMCCFLISCLESAVATKKLISADGTVILKFDVTTVWRLVDHARNAKKSIPAYAEKNPKPSLWLVGDSGGYLMSNGSPAIDDKGHLIKGRDTVGVRRLTAPALGVDPTYNAFEDWWSLHNAIAGGDDFSISIPIKRFEKVLPFCKSQIILLFGRDKYEIVSDLEFRQN